MRNFQRVMAIVLCLASLLGLLSGCAGVSDNTSYATKGEFFAMFITEKGLYSTKYTNEEIAANETYELEAEVMYEWILIEEDQKGNLSDGVTRDLVAQVCVRFMSFREECVAQAGEAPKIKDLDMCYDKQAVQDAVTLGIFTLSNGYFDGAEKMTYEQCYAAIDKISELSRTVTSDEELDIEYRDDVYEITDTEIYEVNFIESEEDEQLQGEGANPYLQQLSTGNGPQVVQLEKQVTYERLELVVSIFEYNSYPQRYKKGQIILYDPTNPLLQPQFMNCPKFYRAFAGKIVNVEIKGATVKLTLDACPMESLVKDTDGINKFATTHGGKVPEDYIDEDRKDGFSIKKSESGTGVTVGFKHTFTLTDPIYEKQTWRNPEAEPSITLDITLDDFSVTTKNLGKILLGSKSDGEVRVNFNTTIVATAHAGGMRFSPANNGNGGALANIANARWTGGNAGGSENIKLGKADIPLGTSGFSITCYFYLSIRMDGSAHVVATMDNSFLLSIKKGRWAMMVSVDNESEKPELEELNVNANIFAGVVAQPGVYFWGQCLADASITAGLNLVAHASIYKVGEKEAAMRNVFAAQADLDDAEGYSYCIHTELSLVLRGNLLTSRSLIGKVIVRVFKTNIPTFENITPIGSCHFEDGREMSSCSRTNEGAVEVNDSDKIYLDNYKVVLRTGQEQSVSITSVPLNDRQIANMNGIIVTSTDKSVVNAVFHQGSKTIELEGLREGSAEIVIKIKKSKDKKAYYTQTISVTVYKAEASATTDEGENRPGTGSIVVLDAWLSDKSRRC